MTEIVILQQSFQEYIKQSLRESFLEFSTTTPILRFFFFLCLQPLMPSSNHCLPLGVPSSSFLQYLQMFLHFHFIFSLIFRRWSFKISPRNSSRSFPRTRAVLSRASPEASQWDFPGFSGRSSFRSFSRSSRKSKGSLWISTIFLRIWSKISLDFLCVLLKLLIKIHLFIDEMLKECQQTIYSVFIWEFLWNACFTKYSLNSLKIFVEKKCHFLTLEYIPKGILQGIPEEVQ